MNSTAPNGMATQSTDDLSPAYRAACQAHSAAYYVFTEAQRAYRAREIGDDGYLSARRTFDAATVAYDQAFDAESRRQCA